ncbi:MAG: hypothetical protein U0M95_09220 [Ruminococcus sp.]
MSEAIIINVQVKSGRNDLGSVLYSTSDISCERVVGVHTCISGADKAYMLLN